MNTLKYQLIEGIQNQIHDGITLGTRVNEILTGLKISKKRFTKLFKSNNDLITEVINIESQRLFEKLDEFFVDTKNPIYSLIKYIDWRTENIENNETLIYKISNSTHYNSPFVQKMLQRVHGKYLSKVLKMLELAKANGQLMSSTPAKELASFIIYTLEGSTIAHSITNNKESKKEVVEMLKRTIRSYRMLD